MHLRIPAVAICAALAACGKSGARPLVATSTAISASGGMASSSDGAAQTLGRRRLRRLGHAVSDGRGKTGSRTGGHQAAGSCRLLRVRRASEVQQSPHAARRRTA